MFKVLLKHIIYERCIDVFFDVITTNFSTHKPKTEVEIISELLQKWDPQFWIAPPGGYKGSPIEEHGVIYSPYASDSRCLKYF